MLRGGHCTRYLTFAPQNGDWRGRSGSRTEGGSGGRRCREHDQWVLSLGGIIVCTGLSLANSCAQSTLSKA